MRHTIIFFLLLSNAVGCSDTPKDPVVASVPNCSLDAQVGCVARADFPAANKAGIVAGAGNIKTGNTFGGVAGTMPLCSTDNGIGCIATSDFPSVVKSTLTAANVVSGSTLVGIAGSFAPPCTTDGAVDCLTTSAFKAIDLAPLTIWDIRTGKTIAGLTGSSTRYTSAARLTTFNRTMGTASNADANIVDHYDSIDDNANNLAIPSEIPVGAPGFVSNWIRDPASDTDMTETCSGMEACIYNDQLTGLSWLADNSMTYVWEAAITYCVGLTTAGHEDWRLPTQKELMQAYVNRIWSLKNPLGLATGEYYSSTTVSANQTNAWTVTLGTGVVSSLDAKSGDSNHILCVRDY